MIPRALNDIEWSDVELLRDIGREEDDTIEFKSSFSGGADFLALTDSQRIKAVTAIAREAVAFLNGRGRDIIVGVNEAKNDHPIIEDITPIRNVVATVDRLAQSLSAVIEPTQAVLGIRAIRNSENAAEGVIVIRAPSSLRAPHRLSSTKECYIRRGRESVPMPMDEIQDVTLGRAMRRGERNEVLNAQFEGMAGGRVGYQQLPSDRFSIRLVFVPFLSQDHTFSLAVLEAMTGTDPEVYFGTSKLNSDVAFKGLPFQWRPTIRAQEKAGYAEQKDNDSPDFQFCRKLIRNDGVLITDYAACSSFSNSGPRDPYVYLVWILGYLANSIESFRSVVRLNPALLGGTLRMAVNISGVMSFAVGRQWTEYYHLPASHTAFPDFEVQRLTDFDGIFRQLQIDLMSLAGKSTRELWTFNPDP